MRSITGGDRAGPPQRGIRTRGDAENGGIPVTESWLIRRGLPAAYLEVRPLMRTGDLIACEGRGLAAWIVRWATRSDVSHVAVVYRTWHCVQLIETVKVGALRGRVGVTRLSNRVADDARGGRVWWLPLAPDVRAAMDADRLVNSMMRQIGVPYDLWQAIHSATLLRNRRSAARLFCSEAVAKAYVDAGILAGDFNWSEATPGDARAWPIYGECRQLAGRR